MKSLYLLVSLIILSALSGCLLDFKKGYCEILGYEVVDNGGRIGVTITFNSSGGMSFEARKPDGEIVDRLFVPYCCGRVTINVSAYHENPKGSGYKVLVYDGYGNKVEEIPLDFVTPRLRIKGCNVTWWREGRNSYAIIEIALSIQNEGSIPVYVDRAVLSVGNKVAEVKTLQNTLLPGSSRIVLSPYVSSLPYKDHDLSITLLDIDNYNLANFSLSVQPVTDFGLRRFSDSWNFKGKSYFISIPLPQGLYEYCSTLPRPNTQDYSFYAIDPKVRGFIEMLSSKLRSIYRGNDPINFVASFVQNIDYKGEEGEYPKYPIELLHDRGGDCEDKAILASAILFELGYDVCLIRFEDHMAVGVHLEDYREKVFYLDENGKAYVYLETANTGWFLGMADDKYKNARNYTIHHVCEKPIIDLRCKPPIRHQVGNKDYIDFLATIENIGSRDATDLKLVVTIDLYGEEMRVTESELYHLKCGGGRDIYMRFDTPPIPFSELHVKVVTGDKVRAESRFVFL